jgi:8-oxo-dGTP diphosphatase
MKFEVFEPFCIPDNELTYVVVCSMTTEGKWVFVRHKERNTLEMPAGHIEKGESAIKAAHRELWEETGAIKYRITPINDYTITLKENTNSGRLYLSVIDEFGNLPEYEIAEIVLRRSLPKNLTYSEIQGYMFRIIKNYLSQNQPE